MNPESTTQYIYATVSSWKYVTELPSPKEDDGEPEARLHLDAVIDSSDTLEKGLHLGLCIIGKKIAPDDENFLSPWQLDLLPPLDEPPLPRCFESVLTLSEATLQDLKESLFLTATSKDCYVQLSFGVQEIQPGDIAERSFAIVEFGFALHHQKEAM